ncbi:hypothetical protein V1289_006346 [Bradyrhizobium sp. AZCC 2289]
MHGWRLADNRHMRMSGYPGRVRSMSWSAGGKGLATSGSEKSHISAGRSPIDHEQSLNSSTTEGGNETVSSCKVGYSGSMQRERCAQQGGNAAFGNGKVT